jgi:hypothetical protein
MYEVMVDAKDTERTFLEQSAYASHPRVNEHKLYARYSKRWADYFRAFEAKLPHLQHFRFGQGPNWWCNETTPFEEEGRITIEFHEPYMTYCDGYGPSQYMQRLIWDREVKEENGGFKPEDESRVKPGEEDRAALEHLLKKTGQNVELDEEGKNCHPPSWDD